MTKFWCYSDAIRTQFLQSFCCYSDAISDAIHIPFLCNFCCRSATFCCNSGKLSAAILLPVFAAFFCNFLLPSSYAILLSSTAAILLPFCCHYAVTFCCHSAAIGLGQWKLSIIVSVYFKAICFSDWIFLYGDDSYIIDFVSRDFLTVHSVPEGCNPDGQAQRPALRGHERRIRPRIIANCKILHN